MLSAKRDDLVKRNIVDVWQQNFKVIEHGICTLGNQLRSDVAP